MRNSFHCNGDQTDKGYSKFRYRPFTLEGNFAAAAGLQEMLIQSYSGTVRVFPAIPKDWQDVSFDKLRAEGAFVISAECKGGRTVSVTVVAEKGGTLRLENPFGAASYDVIGASAKTVAVEGNDLVLKMSSGRTVTFRRR